MYGYTRPGTSTDHNKPGQGLMPAGLNSISSSISSIDTLSRRAGGHNNKGASVDNLITTRSHSITAASQLWKADREDRYSSAARSNGLRGPGSEIYYGKERNLTSCCCLKPRTALNFLLVPLLLITVARQVFDFLGQLWLQILINFFTILLLIFALFGIKQARISYLTMYAIWALLNSVWNLVVICVHYKLKDVLVTEEALSLFTGATSWWHSNGPGCAPFSINGASIQPATISILQPSLITGCKLDYHLIESAQAALHCVLSFITSLLACCLVLNIRRQPPYTSKNRPNTDTFYRLNNLVNTGLKVNQNPSPIYAGTSRATTSNFDSLRRANNKTSSRASRHSMSSVRSRRRTRHSTEGTLPSQRGSTSSMQRSQQYCSLSSRRSTKGEKRDNSSLTYEATSEIKPAKQNSQRTRLSSLSSADYLPSYQPPHSSRANLLSSYGEVSSIDSYNNRNGTIRSRRSNGRPSTSQQGNTNPVYSGSKSSIYSSNHNGVANKYDDLSYIYGNNSVPKSGESVYGDGGTYRRKQLVSQPGPSDTMNRRNGHQQRNGQYTSIKKPGYDDDTGRPHKSTIANGTFNSFVNHSTDIKSHYSGENHSDANNNYSTFNYQEIHDGGNDKSMHEHHQQPHRVRDSSSVILPNGNNNTNQQQHIYNSRNPMYPIYSNHAPNGNSETPI